MKLEGKNFTLTPSLNHKGIRLDQFISFSLKEYSRNLVSSLIGQGYIKVNNQIRKSGYRIKGEEVIDIFVPETKPCSFDPEAISLDILYEDEFIVLVNKPAGMVVHPAPGNPSGTLVNALLHHCKDIKGIGGEQRPGIIHRLDKETTGIMIVAKTQQAHEHLSAQFRERHIQKLYVALVHGSIQKKKGLIDLPIGRHPVHRKKMSIHAKSARDALTLWQLDRSFDGVHLLDIHIKTGRTHQIRVHLSATGNPIVGDPLYGSMRALSRMAHTHPETYRIISTTDRQMLHSRSMTFCHPITKEEMRFEAPLPLDFFTMVNRLQSCCDQKFEVR